MILFACECGSPYSVEDNFAGGTLECTACGKGNQIPADSDPRVALVFRSGESEDGVPMLREEVERLVAAGEFTETELIWDGMTWRPVTDVMGGGVLATATVKPELRLKTKEEGSDEEDEDLPFDDIEPIQKVQLDDEEQKHLPTQKREKRRKAKEKKGGAEATGLRLLLRRASGNDSSLGPRVNIPIQLFWFLIVAFFGFRLGVGPLISKMRGTPTYVVVYNHGESVCIASLGWRRMKKEIHPGTSVCFEVYVGMRETQTVTLTPKEGGKVIKGRVPMWPGGLTVVNPGKLGTYGLWELDAVRDEKLSGADMKRLAEQVGAHKEPSAVVRLVAQGRRIAKKALADSRTDAVFTSDKYEFQPSIVNGDAVAVAEFMKNLAETREKSKKQHDLVTFPARQTVDFSGGSVLFDANDEKRVQMSLHVPKTVFQAGKNQTIKLKGNPELAVTGGKGGLRLSIEVKDHSSKFGSRTYKGTWRYEAWQSKGKWDWKWSFAGHDGKAPKGKQTVAFRYDRSRKETGPSFR